MKMISVLTTAVLILALSTIATLASEIPSGSYSSWTQAQQQQAANALKEKCGNTCSSYTQRAQDGSMRASYEASACTIACFVNNLPDDYPGLDSLKKSAQQNYKQAKDLGSNIPVFVNK